MNNFLIRFKTLQNTQSIVSNVEAYNMEDAIKKLQKIYPNVRVVSFTQV